MTEQTSLLSLPYIMPSQAQKHVTHNEALRMLDALLQIRVEGIGLDTPPGAPADGERHVVGGVATGAFAGHAGEVACWQDGAWAFFAPRAGWLVWDAGEDALMVFDGAAWTHAFETQNIPLLGVNTTADTTNRFAVAAPATLLSHEGAGHQLKINKAASGDTASLLFQTGWSGRAEMGLAGNDDFSVKVSADGAAWTTALRVAAGSGNVGIGADPTSARLLVAGPDGSIDSKSTSAAGYAGMNIYDSTGAMAFSFQYGNPGAVDFTNEAAFASRQASIPLKFYQGGTGAGDERLRIDASGCIALLNAQVGVGTATPISDALLEARRDQAGSNITRIAVNNPNANGLSAFSLYGGPGNVERGRMQYNSGSPNVFFTTIGAIPFYIGTNNTARITITAAGSVNVTSGLVSATASAKLQVDSTTQGFLPPRMTEAQRDAIASPAEGLVLYNTTAHAPQFWNGSAWIGM